MARLKRFVVATLLSAAFFSPHTAFSASPEVLARVAEMYGLDEEEAESRLAAEASAADLYQRVRGGRIGSYAGAWFDADQLGLRVAISNSADSSRVEELGAFPTVVEFSLQELEAAFTLINGTSRPEDSVFATYIDFPSNRVIVEVRTSHLEAIETLFSELADRIQIVESNDTAVFSADVRGAEGFHNDSRANQYGGVWPCSIGLAHTLGFFTAGHCGIYTQDIHDTSGTPLGDVEDSNLPFNYWGRDVATVYTLPGWTPTTDIEGFAAADMTVQAKWGGYGQAPVFTTVCRYGHVSGNKIGAPFCGQIDALGVSTTVQNMALDNLTAVDGICTDGGDSGGPLVSASDDQVQGVTVGATAINTCPSTVKKVYFQPIQDHIAAGWNTPVVSAHGANIPTISGLDCLESGVLHPPGTWSCKFDYYNSQGTPAISWSAGFAPTTDLTVSGACASGISFSVTLTLTNSYGADSWPSTFTCP
jgi:streptogrisin C